MTAAFIVQFYSAFMNYELADMECSFYHVDYRITFMITNYFIHDIIL